MIVAAATSLYIEEKVRSLFQADSLAAHQYFNTFRRKDGLGPEEKLMLAVLEEGISCFQKYLFAQDKGERRLFREAQDWILEEGKEEPFSFENICEVLGIAPNYLRRGLLRWKQKQLARRRRAMACKTASPNHLQLVADSGNERLKQQSEK